MTYDKKLQIGKLWKRGETRNGDGFQFEHEGVMGINYKCSNAHQIEVAYHYGSKSSFGARSWPHVTLEVAFEAGQEDKAAEFAKQLAELTDKFLA